VGHPASQGKGLVKKVGVSLVEGSKVINYQIFIIMNRILFLSSKLISHFVKTKSLKTTCIITLGLTISSFLVAQTNVAKNKATSQSSHYSLTAGQPQKAVDGNTDGRWSSRSVTHTKSQKNPWWTVDLGEVHDISKVQIWNRTDCCRNRLNNIKILIKKKPRDGWKRFNSRNHKYQAGESYPLTFNKIHQARYVMVQLETANGILSLAEVKVFGKPAGSSTTVSYRPATKIGNPKGCSSGSFFDPIDGGTCWTCPPGYKRTVLSVKGNKACERPAGEIFKRANKHGRGKGLLGTDCDGGQFLDPNGYCYSCPNGYNRTAYSVNSAKACAQRVRADYKPAAYKGKFGVCSRGFFDISTKKCWTCPSGYKRTVFSVTSGKACEKTTTSNF